MNTTPLSDSTRRAIAALIRSREARAEYCTLFVANDALPRVTRVYALDTEAEIIKIAAWMNRYPETLAQRAAAKYSQASVTCPKCGRWAIRIDDGSYLHVAVRNLNTYELDAERSDICHVTPVEQPRVHLIDLGVSA